MKIITVYLFFAINLFACKIGSLDAGDCLEVEYRHKSEAELAAMSPRQLMVEEVKEEIYHGYSTFFDKDHDDDYRIITGNYLDKFGNQIWPILIKFMDEFDPKRSSKCEQMLFQNASRIASVIDNYEIRLRATKDGQLAMEALQRSVDRMRAAGFDKSDHVMYSDFSISALHLEMAKGTNIHDEMIRATLQARHSIQMSESEYLEFSNFLTELDPTYPTWSEAGEYGPPMLLKESKRYFEGYLKFKAKKSGSEVVK